MRSFFDTDVLIYADDKAAVAKQRRALELLAEHRRARTGVVSMQVLQEYFVTVTRKLHVDLAVARRKVELLAEFDVAAPEVGDILAAIDLHRLHGFLSGMRWWCARPSKRAAECFIQKTCRESERLMESASSIRFAKGNFGRRGKSSSGSIETGAFNLTANRTGTAVI